MTARYFDNALGSGANNGSSWANAWRTASAIVWGGAGVVAGDTLYVSGGTTSKTYLSTGGTTTILAVGASGSAGSPITVTAGIDAGHNGTVILDGQNGSRDCIDLISRTYVTVQNLTLQNPGTGWDCVWCTGCGNIILQDLVLHLGGTNSGGSVRGIEVRGSTADIQILRITGDTGANFTDQTDIIYTTVNNTAGVLITIDGCDLEQKNLNATGHNDALQLGSNTCNHRVSNNKLTVTSPGGSNVHIANLWDINTANGYTEFYNNVVVAVGANQSAAFLIQALAASAVGRFRGYNNTIYTSNQAISLVATGGGTIHVLSEFKNNAIYMTAGTAFVNPNSWTPTSAAQVDYNSIYLTGGAAAYSGTHASWNANTVSTDPLFVSNGTDFHLQATSPLKNAGTTIASVTVDKDGIARPQGAAYDIGAYELIASAPWRYRLFETQLGVIIAQ